MKIYATSLFFCLLVCTASSQRKDDFYLRSRTSQMPDYPVFTQDDMKEIAAQGATLQQISFRLDACQNDLAEIKHKVDDQIMPTIHVFDFLKWLIGAIIVALIGIWLNDKFRPATHS